MQQEKIDPNSHFCKDDQLFWYIRLKGTALDECAAVTDGWTHFDFVVLKKLNISRQLQCKRVERILFLGREIWQ